jgi:hypothetical protein
LMLVPFAADLGFQCASEPERDERTELPLDSEKRYAPCWP